MLKYLCISPPSLASSGSLLNLNDVIEQKGLGPVSEQTLPRIRHCLVGMNTIAIAIAGNSSVAIDEFICVAIDCVILGIIRE